MEDIVKNFPINGLMPKKETGALSFLSKYGNYDGRGVIIAVLDTGVDPSAIGLQSTTDSKPKILDLIDATGAGNCDISTERVLDADKCLTGSTGRKLKVPSNWSNPSGKYYCGMKPLFDLCSVQLRERIRNERKEKLWQPFHDEAMVVVQKKLNDFSLTNSKQGSQGSSASSSTTSLNSTTSDDNSAASNDLLNTLKKEDLQAQQELIKDLESKVKDIGPVYDVLVWFDGDTWRCCIDTTESGDLKSCQVLTNYRDSYEYGTFSYMDMLNYSVRIMQNENVVQIVTDSGSHGTHVAGIAAGYYPDKPELNGIAPGAQIVSIKIGDNRLNGMETGFALVNACRFIIENNCDLVNYSFGEPVTYASTSPNIFFAQDLIEKFGVILCASAGNNGPGIETADAPGGYGNAAISVAAYVSNDMIKAEHSLLGNGSSMLFTWSSRGPTLDGHSGVSVCAPGGAFANVPSNTLRGTQLMSGTSMSSPNCCGCLALILSGLKQKNIEFNPFGVKRAIENTATPVDEVVGSGAGLIQVEKAYDYLVAYKESIFQKIHFNIKHTLRSKSYRGIYLKHADDLTETRDYLVTVEPTFFENKLKTSLTSEKQIDLNDKDLLDVQKEKISMNKKIGLVCDNNDNGNSWIEYPPHLYLYNSSRQFYVRIRANELEEGKCYYTQIKAYDLDDPKMTCLFKIPITVVKPFTFDKKVNNDYQVDFKNVSFKQGQIYRHFFRAPIGATHAELTLTCDNSNGKDHTPFFYIQSFTLENFRSQIDAAKEDAYRLNTTNEIKYLFKVQSNKVVQLTIAKNWSNIGQVHTNYKVKFSGLYPKNSSEICCLSSRPFRLEVGSYLRNEDCEVSTSWKHHIQPLKPSESLVENVKQSFGLLKPIFQIVLTYNFHQTKTDEICCEVPLLSHLLYENEYQSMFWMIFEANSKRFMLAGDAFPVHYKYARSLEKGDYIIRLHVRHEKIEMLEKLKDISIYVRHTISGAINQDLFSSYNALLKASGKKTISETIQRNNEATFFLNVIPEDKLPKGIANGHFLSGELSLYKDSQISKVDNHKIYYQINNYGSSASSKKSEKATSQIKSSKTTETSDSASSTSAVTSTVATNKTKSDEDKLNEVLRDAKVAWILKSKDVFESIRSEYENHIPVYVNRITFLQQQIASTQNEMDKYNYYDEIIDLCRTAIDKIDQNDLFRYFGQKHHDPSTDENKKEFENQKSWIIELLSSQGAALIEKNCLNKSDESYSTPMSAGLLNELKSIYRSIQKWIDITDDKVSKFYVKFLLSQQLYGKALKVLFKQLEEKQSSQPNDKLILNVLKQMNLQFAFKYYENHLIMKYQKAFIAY